MSVTAKELARDLGLSEAAVSFALRNKRGVSEQTRLRVVERARELGYDFTRGAANLPAVRGTVCLALCRRSGVLLDVAPFLPTLMDAVRSAAGSLGYGVDVRAVGADARLYKDDDEAYAGMLVLGTELRGEDIASMRMDDGPCVFLDILLGIPGYDCICADDRLGGMLAAQHLLSMRRGQPGYLRSAYPTDAFFRRGEGFLEAVRQSGFSPARCATHVLSPTREGAAADMHALLCSGVEPQRCYFADSDEIAAGAMDALLEGGWHVPQDVAIVGFGDTPLGCEIGLTSVRAPWSHLGALAVQRLTRRIQSEDHVPSRLLADVKLIKRRTA